MNHFRDFKIREEKRTLSHIMLWKKAMKGVSKKEKKIYVVNVAIIGEYDTNKLLVSTNLAPKLELIQ